ncbi:MAG TPA: DsrE/DsrF/DrsH-like family protein [Thermoplasmata archaeon]
MADKMCMVVCEGSFDKAMMPLIMGTTAAAMGTEVHVFYTFFGTKLVTKKANPKLPGIMRLFTGVFAGRMKKVGIPGHDEFMQQAQDMGVNLYACSTTMGLMGVKDEDLKPGVKVLGAAAFLKLAGESQTTLFIG